MSVIFNIILITTSLLLNDGQGQKITPFPHLIDFKESDIGKPYYNFDGVDYSLIPTFIYNRDFKNCYEEHTRCTRFVLYANPVCGYDSEKGKIRPYYSICELDLASCKNMKERNVKMHGTNYRNRGVYFLGEGYNCEIHVRRIAGGLVPRDIRDAPEDETKPDIPMNNKYDVVTRATELQHDKTIPNISRNSEYDNENIMY